MNVLSKIEFLIQKNEYHGIYYSIGNRLGYNTIMILIVLITLQKINQRSPLNRGLPQLSFGPQASTIHSPMSRQPPGH